MVLDRSSCTLETGFETYTEMVFTKFSVTRDDKTGDAMRFTATMQQVRTVSTALIAFKVSKDKRAGGKVDKGVQSPQKVPEAQTRGSIAHAIVDKVQANGGLVSVIGSLFGGAP